MWLSTSWTPDSTAETVLDTIDKMASYGIPLSVYHFDARWMADFRDCDFQWHPRYGDPREMIRKIHERGVKVCVWINPYVSQASRLFREGLENGYFIKKPDGSVWQYDLWIEGTAIVDFTNPAAAKWYAQRLGEVIDMGVDCVKTDFGERIPTDVVYYDGSDPVKMHNYYAFLYNKTIFEMLQEKHGKGEACVFSRSSTVGTQQFPVNWGGDNASSYVSMAESLRGGLSFCQSGFGFWSHDMSGFEKTATPDLYNRWAAFGMLSTHSRLHGSSSLRMPWCFAEECCHVLKFFAELKCSLMPYIFAGAVEVGQKGYPEMRAMMLEFPDDLNCATLDRQYMLGGRLLVAPVFNDRGEASYYVPEGNWTEYLTGRPVNGGKWVRKICDYYTIPLLVRPNTILAVGAHKDKTVYDYTKGVEFRVYALSESAECAVYDGGVTKTVTAKAVREGDTLRFTVEGPAVGWKLRMVNVAGGQVSGGKAEKDGNDLVIDPEQNEITVRV